MSPLFRISALSDTIFGRKARFQGTALTWGYHEGVPCAWGVAVCILIVYATHMHAYGMSACIYDTDTFIFMQTMHVHFTCIIELNEMLCSFPRNSWRANPYHVCLYSWLMADEQQKGLFHSNRAYVRGRMFMFFGPRIIYIGILNTETRRPYCTDHESHMHRHMKHHRCQNTYPHGRARARTHTHTYLKQWRQGFTIACLGLPRVGLLRREDTTPCSSVYVNN